MTKISYSGYRFPPEIIHQAIWLYLWFTLTFRDVEDLLAERGIVISYETVRRWVHHFGPMIAADLGCVAGEGHLDGEEPSLDSNAELLAAAVVTHAHDLKARLIVLKEFPAKYREPLRCFLSHGFSRVPSLPMTRLNIDYSSFDDYMTRALN